MIRLRPGFSCWLASMMLASLLAPAVAADSSFPYGSELMLNVPPKPGTKRIPTLQVEENGAATLDLWCVTSHQQATIGDATITFIPQPVQPAQCAPALLAADEDLLAAFADVTSWKRTGDAVDLIGTTPLHFRLMTN